MTGRLFGCSEHVGNGLVALLCLRGQPDQLGQHLDAGVERFLDQLPLLWPRAGGVVGIQELGQET